MYRNSRQSWILDYTPWIPDSRYWIPTSVSRTFWIQIVSGIADTLSCFPDSNTNFPRILDSTSKNFLYSEIRIPFLMSLKQHNDGSSKRFSAVTELNQHLWMDKTNKYVGILVL